jgi:hypothetical protein
MIRLLRFTALLSCLCMAGCAFGRLGTLVARRTLTQTAEVVEVFGCGLLLRPTRHDGGVSIGFRRATYIYPRLAGDTRPAGQSLHWGWVPLRADLPFFLGTREVGLEFQTVAGISMLHAGYVDQGLTFVAEAGQSRCGQFHYTPPHPERTVLSIREEWEGLIPFSAANP